MQKVKTNQLGASKVQVSALGLGTATIGGNMGAVSGDDARAMVQTALEAGVTYLDTAPYYGFGKSEHVTGDMIRDQRETVVLSTKVGRLLKPQIGPYDPPSPWADGYPFYDHFDYSYDGIMRSFEASLQRLGTNKIDILLVHDVAPDTLGDAAEFHFKVLEKDGYRALEQLRSSGQIGAIGMGNNMWEVQNRALDIGDWDAFLLAGRYTLLEQECLDPFLKRCVEFQTSIIVGGPFNSGLLVGGDTWNYEKAPAELVAKVHKVSEICAAHNVPLPAAALRFPFGHEAVATTIPGPKSKEELTQILQWWDTDIPDALWDELKSAGLIEADAPTPKSADW